MTDFDQFTDPVFDAIKDHVDNTWDAAPVAWPNDAFNRPMPATPWVLVEISGTMYGQESIGASEQADNRWDEGGIVWFHVFVPIGAKTGSARGAAKALANLFRGKTMLGGRLSFGDAAIGMGEPGDGDGNYFRVSVSIQWNFMEA